MTVVPRCADCKWAVQYEKPGLFHCHRFPNPVGSLGPDHWCAEFRTKQ